MAKIESKRLRKNYGAIEAVKDISFKVDRGEVLGFLGPNGAGKTTLMRMLTCFLTPTSGTATIGGHDILNESLKARSIIGYLPETNPLYSDMTTDLYLRFIGEMRGFRGKELEKRVESIKETCQLKEVQTQNLDTLSKGYKRRVGLAQALIHDPEILILDEPTDGLDPNQKHDVRRLINQMAPNKCIVISTHILEEVDAVCSRAIIINNGEIVADETPDKLKERSKFYGAVRIGIKRPDKAIEKTFFEAIPDVRKVEEEEAPAALQRFLVLPVKGKQISQKILERVNAQHLRVEEMFVEEGRLDEVFRTITKEGGKN